MVQQKLPLGANGHLIKVDRKSVVYMYVGRGAVDHDQTVLFGGLVVVCKSWKWAAMIYTAARIAGLASNNYFGNIAQELVISADDDDTDNNATELLPTCGSPKMCEEMWNRLRTTPDFLIQRLPTFPATNITKDPCSPTPSASNSQNGGEDMQRRWRSSSQQSSCTVRRLHQFLPKEATKPYTCRNLIVRQQTSV